MGGVSQYAPYAITTLTEVTNEMEYDSDYYTYVPFVDYYYVCIM